MIQIAIDRVLSRRDFGSLFSGVASDGRRAIVSTTEPVFPVVGEAYAVEGEETRWRDDRGFDHRRIEATRLVRVRASGRLLLPWLKTLPGVGEQRAKRLLDRWGQDLLDVLADPSRQGEIAQELDPSRPLLAAKLAALVQAGYLAKEAEERMGIAEARFLAQLEEHGVEHAAAARRLWRLIGSADAWIRLSQRPYVNGIGNWGHVAE